MSDLTSNLLNYFSNPAVQKHFQSARQSLRSPSIDQQLAQHTIWMIDVLSNQENNADEHCQINIKILGDSLTADLTDIENNQDARVIFSKLYRFILEYEFTTGYDFSVLEHLKLQEYIQKHLDDFSGSEREQIKWAGFGVPMLVAKKALSNPNVKGVNEYVKIVKNAEEYKSAWESDMKAKTAEMNALREELKTISSGFNFVGLVDGFRKLRTSKQEEQSRAFKALTALGITMLSPAIGELWLAIREPAAFEALKANLIYLLPALVTLELLFVYFFRIVLLHFRSLKAQLLQLDLRVSLCQFIQSYAEYAAKLKKQSEHTLDKFESIVFSGLTSTEESLPTTFDGADQLANFIKSIKA